MTRPLAARTRRRTYRTVASAAILGALAILAVVTLRRSPPTIPAIPEPNGYDLFVQAGRLIEGPPPNEGNLEEADPEALRSWVLANRDALDLADQGIELPSGVPLRFTQRDAEMQDLGEIRNLARLMRADAMVAQQEGRIEEAADRSVAILRLARQGTRNGLLLHAMTGFAIERSGIEGLRLLRDDLDGEQCRMLARSLIDFEEGRPDIEETIALETQWGQATMPRGMKVAQAILPGVRARLDGLLIPALDSARNSSLRASTYRRLLAIDLAIRGYRARHGSLPERLDQLVPEFLPELPIDPFTDAPFVYRLSNGETEFALYSVGPDGQDDGGTPYPQGVDWTRTPGDLALDPSSP